MDASMVLNTSETVTVGDGDDTGTRSDAGDVKHNVDATDGLQKPVRHIEQVQGCARHLKWHGYDCRRNEYHQYKSKDCENTKPTC